MARKVGIHTRISRDDEGDAPGVARQRTDCERLADLRTWQPVKIYEDNDVSAFKRNVVRDEFELMLKDLRAGLIDGVVAYDLDRLARQPRDLERLIEIFDERPRLEFATVTNDVNLGTADGPDHGARHGGIRQQVVTRHIAADQGGPWPPPAPVYRPAQRRPRATQRALPTSTPPDTARNLSRRPEPLPTRRAHTPTRQHGHGYAPN
ncbi:recombinase family protein [Streptomyces sp. NPDC007875]|uniref:recombinase family protein n=1 Tax=Streptomyces sp. NPDC007875 TaxID=3364783 RepID=UPI003695B4DB